MEARDDDIRDLARDLAERIRWEAELGGVGYLAASAARGAEPATESAPEPCADPAATLASLRAEIGDCTRCRLHEGRTKLVFGDGDPRARLAFVGEGPGHDEDLSGVPFVGAAGQLLTKIIAAIGLDRKDVYICNVVKCRPPKNRDPEPDEVAVCGQFLERQLAIVAPRVIVALGRPAAQFLLATKEPITALRGRFVDRGAARVMPTFHQAYLLRNESAKRPVWEDMKLVREALGLAGRPSR
jgi:uracil-DNA glycosylase